MLLNIQIILAASFILRYIQIAATCMEDCKDNSKSIHQKLINFNPPPFSTSEGLSYKKQIPLAVYTEIYLEDLNSFRPVTMDFRLDFFLKHHWSVPRNTCLILLDEAREKHFGGGITSKSMIIKAKEVKHMWLPDTYIGNSKVVETPAKDSSTSFIIIRSVGQQCTVEYTLRLAAIVSCQMDFKHYPVDIQVCPFNLRSFSYPKEMVIYVWDQEGPPPINPEMRMLRHRVAISKGKSEIHMLNMTYSMLYVNLTFERDLAHHLIQVFTPSALIVMLSWLSFWLGADATAGRITLCVTSLLALITQFSSIRRDLPPLSYIHASHLS
ncbi:gamma-aminobutyric acid receptor subunit beta [Caerostris darwini]|uniref:Gamma-aminobutyric acid receptor subunit beta n=1 Tax=Caerostris darwini TaxID=1538125 RepID=A0AAV4R4I0_9ARAC|nr:gamma-aminobutyric acid receptor subunit beta [Caerostris darwini]